MIFKCQGGGVEVGYGLLPRPVVGGHGVVTASRLLALHAFGQSERIESIFSSWKRGSTSSWQDA